MERRENGNVRVVERISDVKRHRLPARGSNDRLKTAVHLTGLGRVAACVGEHRGERDGETGSGVVVGVVAPADEAYE